MAFKKSPQGLNDAKSKARIKRAATMNILAHIRTEIEDRNIIQKTFDRLEEEIGDGKIKNAVEILKIAREPEQQGNINNGVMVQKVYVTSKQRREAEEHIDTIIGEINKTINEDIVGGETVFNKQQVIEGDIIQDD